MAFRVVDSLRNHRVKKPPGHLKISRIDPGHFLKPPGDLKNQPGDLKTNNNVVLYLCGAARRTRKNVVPFMRLFQFFVITFGSFGHD